MIKSITFIHFPLCLLQYIYNYGFYFDPVSDTINTLPSIVNDNYYLTLQLQDDVIITIINSIVETIIPFTVEWQQTYQLPFDFIQHCIKPNVAATFTRMLNNSRNANLIQNVTWLMSQMEHAIVGVSNNERRRSVWSDIANSINFSTILAHFRRRKKIHHNIWILILGMTQFARDNITRKRLKRRNIFGLMIRQLTQLNVRAAHFYKCLDLYIIQEITAIFSNFCVYSPQDVKERDNGIFNVIFEMVFLKMISITDYIETLSEEEYNNNEGYYEKMFGIISIIWYNMIESLFHLMNHDDNTNFLDILVNSSQTMTHDNIITNYIKLLDDDDTTMRQYVQGIIIKVTEYYFQRHIQDEQLNQQLIEQYVELGLIEQMSSIVSTPSSDKCNPKEIDNYLLIITNIFYCSYELVSSIVLNPLNEAIIHWLLTRLQQHEDYESLRAMLLILDHLGDYDQDIFKKVIQFKDGLIFKVFDSKLQKYIDHHADLIYNSNSIHCYIPLTNGHVYIFLYFLVLFIEQTKRLKQYNINNTQLISYIYNNINYNKIHVFMVNLFPALYKRLNDPSLRYTKKYLSKFGTYFDDNNMN